MQAAGETDANACQYNDIALIRLNPADYGRVNPSVPFWGGPTGTATTTAQGDKVLWYGNSSLRLGITQLSPKEGLSLGASGGGWTRQVYTVSAGHPRWLRAARSWIARAAASASSARCSSRRWSAPTASATCRAWSPTWRSHGGPDVTLARGTDAVPRAAAARETSQ